MIDLEKALNLIGKKLEGRSDAEISREVDRSDGWLYTLRRDLKKGITKKRIGLDTAEQLIKLLDCQLADIKHTEEPLYNPFDIEDREKAIEDVKKSMDLLGCKDIPEDEIEFGPVALAKARFEELMKEADNHQFMALLLDCIYKCSQPCKDDFTSTKSDADAKQKARERFSKERDSILDRIGTTKYLPEPFKGSPLIQDSWWIYLYYSEYLKELLEYSRGARKKKLTTTDDIKAKYRDIKRNESKKQEKDRLQKILRSELGSLPGDIEEAAIRSCASFLRSYFEGSSEAARRVNDLKSGVFYIGDRGPGEGARSSSPQGCETEAAPSPGKI